ncbi:hypothetical protein Apa02nite_037980 [Actinoplanes palleronii]|uniref:SseB protein N-terminal domain-containing protein n=2 Tax=Actinoplanes palleronii TaxID=113570 RepID=A0ABQ4BBS2_9ACTN|nr:hypothetical protein Apa02nite_037980 [Actinoplanes palleronii]
MAQSHAWGEVDVSEWDPATDAEVAMRDALRTDDQESYFRILAGVDLLLPVSADALAGLAPLGWGTWSTGGRTHVLAFTSQESLHACLSDYTGSSRRVPYAELANTWPNLEWWLAVNPGLPIEGYLPAWFVAQLARGDLRLPTRGPGREVHGTSKIQELGAAALAASRGTEGPGGPTYDSQTPAAAAASGYPAYPAGSSPGGPGGGQQAPQPGPAQPGRNPSGLPQRGAQPVAAGAAQFSPGGAPGLSQFGPGSVPGAAPYGSGPAQFGPGAAPQSPAGQSSGLPARAQGGTLAARQGMSSGLPVRTPTPAPAEQQLPASGNPADQVPAAYQSPTIPRDFPGSPAPVSPAQPTRGTSGSGMATPGWHSDSVPFGPENDPRGPLQDLGAPLPVRTPMANTPPVPEHVQPYDPAEALVDQSWAVGTGRNPNVGAGPAPASPAGPGASPLPTRGGVEPLPTRGGLDPHAPAPAANPLPSRGGDLPSRGGDLPSRGGDLPSRGGDLPSRGGDLPSRGGDLPGRGGADLPRRRPGQTAGASQTTSFSGFTNARTNPVPPEAPSFPQGPASPQAAAAQTAPMSAPPLAAPASSAPLPGAPGNGLPRRQVTPASERPSSMAAAAQALTGGHTPAPDPGLAQREVSAADRFGPSGPAPTLPRSDSGLAGGDRTAQGGRPGLLPPVIPGAPGADRGPGHGGFAAPASGAPAPGYGGAGSAADFVPGFGPGAPGSPVSGSPAAPGSPAGYGSQGGAVEAYAAPGPAFGMPPQGSPASAYANQAYATQILPLPSTVTPAAVAPTSGASGLGVAGSATGGAGGGHENFVAANDTERELQDAADTGNTDVFLSTLLLANVLVPVAHHSRPGSAPGESGFAFQPEEVEGEKFLIVFTSKDRLSEHFGEPTRTVGVRFYELIRNWPDPHWSFAVNPGTPVGAKYPGAQIIALANWATEAGLGADPIDTPSTEETAAPVPAPEPASDETQHATVMQKTIAAEQVDYYLDRGYDRVAGFVHRASEVEHLRTPAELFGALGLNYDSSPFQADAKEAFVLRWPAFRPSLYRIPYGGQNEQALRAMDGWVIERPPFRGNGFAPGESRDVVAEFKVDSVRLPHGAQLWRLDADGNERMLAIFDADGPLWRRVGEQ